MGDIELLPCPFCGREPRLMDLAGFEVLCGCGASMVTGPSQAEAIAAWNTRPGLLARQEGEDRLRDLHRAIRLVYGCVPNLPIDESTMDAATDALHNFCLMVGIHEVDVDSPIDDAARSGGGG